MKNSSCCDLALLQLIYDTQTIITLFKKISDSSIVALYFTPYLSLYCVEAPKILEKYNIKINSNFKSMYDENKMRVKLKCFEDKYKKSEKIIMRCNHIQDYIFKNKLNLKMLKHFNLYYNIGCYIVDNNIVGNTQYAYYIFQDSNLLKKSDVQLNKEEFHIVPIELKNYAAHCGQILTTINVFTQNIANVNITNYSTPKNYRIFYKDFNTNRLFKNSKYKFINIFLLHILSNINFTYYVLQKYEDNDRGFWLKIYYITYYYAIIRIQDLERYLKSSNITILKIDNIFSCTKKISQEMNGDFRSCMMHFEFKNPKQEKILINGEYLDYSKKLFGLVESLFNGMSYDNLKKIILNNLYTMSVELNDYLNIDISNPKEL